jgi:hypothetical protein
MVLRKPSFALMIVPSMLNSMTVWALRMASIFPASSMLRISFLP